MHRALDWVGVDIVDRCAFGDRTEMAIGDENRILYYIDTEWILPFGDAME